jgi:hypothetical protein
MFELDDGLEELQEAAGEFVEEESEDAAGEAFDEFDSENLLMPTGTARNKASPWSW